MSYSNPDAEAEQILHPDKITVVSIISVFSKLRMILIQIHPKKQLPGNSADMSAATYCIMREDHTLGNLLRWMIMKKYAFYPFTWGISRNFAHHVVFLAAHPSSFADTGEL